jgi:AraC-like DNA-binding protein
MATPVTPVLSLEPTLAPSGTLWQPKASLSACVRATLVRNTMGWNLSDAQRVNHFPAAPMCSLSWWFVGHSETLCPTEPDRPATLGDPRKAMPGAWVLGGPQTRPTASWCPGPVHAMMALFMPDALHLMTGVDVNSLMDRLVDARDVLPPEWITMCAQVQSAASDAQRLTLLEDFLDPLWQACRPALPLSAHRYSDWATHLAQRAALSAPGRSLRQLERRIKRWSGLPLRELQVMGRSEDAFFAATHAAQTQGAINWSQVAAEVGYADQSHMIRIARRMTGFSPDALAKGIQNHESFWAYRLWM